MIHLTRTRRARWDAVTRSYVYYYRWQDRFIPRRRLAREQRRLDRMAIDAVLPDWLATFRDLDLNGKKKEEPPADWVTAFRLLGLVEKEEEEPPRSEDVKAAMVGWLNTFRHIAVDEREPLPQNIPTPQRWKCSQCPTKTRGTLENRLNHINRHRQLWISCPEVYCRQEILLDGLVAHLRTAHGKKKKSLKSYERAHLRNEKDRLTREAMDLLQLYFPPKFHCLKCGQNVPKGRSERRDHVGAHLGIEIRCPYNRIGVCSHRGRVLSTKRHLRFAHCESLRRLREIWVRRELETWTRWYNSVVDAEMRNYFHG
uniref:C2H2-type domain-containing protein n=1 Tax=Steinernema glaseri TaxID=37863 RepID=A0A1I7Y0F9_9BILA